MATVGSVGGGWFSSALIRRGWTINAARKTAMLICAVAVLPIALAAHAGHEWTAVLLVGVAAAAHQGWSANVFTLASDMFPRHAVGSVVGFAGMWGALGGMFIAKLTGYLLQTTGSYVPVFMIAASAYLVAIVVIHLLAPRLEPVTLEQR
jgi:ACS family hexuronate transporter-like MFS transporter